MSSRDDPWRSNGTSSKGSSSPKDDPELRTSAKMVIRIREVSSDQSAGSYGLPFAPENGGELRNC